MSEYEILEYWSVEYKIGKRSDFYSFTLVSSNPTTVHIILIPLLHHSNTPSVIHGCWFTAAIHSLSPGFEDQVSGVRCQERGT
jgi:hypothetical protein